MRRALIGGLVAAMVAGCGDNPTSGSNHPRVVILAADGMDPNLLRRLMLADEVPNLKKLASEGGFFPLATANPPQSPVAWSEFISGRHSEDHGIYDFLHRDPETMTPYLSTSKAEGPAHTVEFGEYMIPLGGGDVKLLREGKPFWHRLAQSGVPTTVIKIPAHYPPNDDPPARVLSGMGTPDLLGTPGLFQLFTSHPKTAKSKPSGGRVFPLEFNGGRRAVSALDGPPNPLLKEAPPITVPLEVIIDKKAQTALVRIDGEEILLKVGEFSGWIEVGFAPSLVVPPVPGIVRLFLKSVDPHVNLYVSPVNLDPLAPAQPISVPDDFSANLAEGAGRFYTQGMPEDTKALLADALADEEFLTQSSLVFGERRRMLDEAMDDFEGGFLFFYFSSTDLVAHTFWRATVPDATEEELKSKDAIKNVYKEFDGVLGHVRERLGEDTTLMVMSDHGFAPFTYKVHLNTWLHQNGYLVLADKPDPEVGVLGHIDWSKTRAYALGLNLLYLNMKGRERYGIVTEAERSWLLDKLERDLAGFRDPTNGARVVSRTFRPAKTMHADRAPDLIVGFNRGYRSSDESALGQVGEAVITKNEDKWSGDHCMDPAHVPGVFLSNRTPVTKGGALIDLAPTVLSLFGLDTGELPGTALLGK